MATIMRGILHTISVIGGTGGNTYSNSELSERSGRFSLSGRV